MRRFSRYLAIIPFLLIPNTTSISNVSCDYTESRYTKAVQILREGELISETSKLRQYQLPGEEVDKIILNDRLPFAQKDGLSSSLEGIIKDLGAEDFFNIPGDDNTRYLICFPNTTE